MMIRSFFALREVTPGFTHPEWVQTVRIAIPEALTSDAEQVIRIQSDILRPAATITAIEVSFLFHNPPSLRR